ncbi:MAG: Interferon-induced transmembrane protein [Betaproteobacteria bacterium ADurb.Bin341]|nr:MAG: Interferon-induced transmembrane protein [Betaproteobacteria bacterium ADurb.Bin341]
MFCGQCGKEISERALSCPACGAPTSNVSVPNYLVQAILVTICCCLPFGIPAIVYASQVNSKLAAGDIAGANSSSKSAKMWCWIALGGWLLAVVLYLVIFLIFGAALPFAATL